MAGRCANSPGPAQEVSAPMHPDSNEPRTRGTGSLLSRSDRSGSKSWYGKWRLNGRQVMRRLGPMRMNGSNPGLTRMQAEAELRRAIEVSRVSARGPSGALDVAKAG